MIRDLVLGDALAELIDHRGKTPGKLGTDFVSAGVPVASAILVKGGRLDLSEARCVDHQTFQRWMGVPIKRGDVLLTSEAPLGRVARVETDDPLVLGQRLYGLRGQPGVLDSGYLYYALQTERVQADLVGRSTGTTVFGIRQSALRKVVIPAPGFDQQRAIAEVLGALDDKIAANDHLIRLTGELADAQFATASGGIEFGPATFGDIAQIGGGSTPKTTVDNYWGGDVLWATPTDVTGLSAPYLTATNRRITDAGLASCSSPLYSAGSILMTSRATIGAFAIAERPMAVNQGFIVVNAKEPDLQWWLYHEMRSRVDEFIAHANGATFLELPRGRFKQLTVRYPTLATAAKFAGAVGPLHGLAAQLLLENEALGKTRDDLLPLLMSGRLRVKDAEKIAEEAL